MKVLVVDDETPITDAVTYSLRREGYEALAAGDAERCLQLLRTEKPDLIILDVMLPSANGFEVCRRIRRESEVPIIMLTARAEEADRVVGLELGADDYMTKPFSMRELVARVKTILRRAGPEAEGLREVVRVGDLVIDVPRHEVTIAGKSVQLTPREFDLLRFLAGHAGQVFSRQALLDRVWGPDAFVEERTVDVHVRWLREKIEADPAQPVRLRTVRGVGYKYSS